MNTQVEAKKGRIPPYRDIKPYGYTKKISKNSLK
jgi:hypothetical protein